LSSVARRYLVKKAGFSSIKKQLLVLADAAGSGGKSFTRLASVALDGRNVRAAGLGDYYLEMLRPSV